MGYTFDWFVAEMRCPRCGAVSPADETTGMQTGIQDQPQLAFLGIGDYVTFDFSKAGERGYVVLHEPRRGEPIVLLTTWDCPTCDKPQNWARVVIQDGRIVSIEATAVTSEQIEEAHLISDDCIDIVKELVDEPYDTLVDQDLAPLLRDALRRAGR
jgi:hypothetical protein